VSELDHCYFYHSFKQFLSELYVFLIDEMHTFLNDYLAVEDEPLAEINPSDVQQLRHFAIEAEMNQNKELAAYYYQEVSKIEIR
jgi:hypothetical protein